MGGGCLLSHHPPGIAEHLDDGHDVPDFQFQLIRLQCLKVVQGHRLLPHHVHPSSFFAAQGEGGEREGVETAAGSTQTGRNKKNPKQAIPFQKKISPPISSCLHSTLPLHTATLAQVDMLCVKRRISRLDGPRSWKEIKERGKKKTHQRISFGLLFTVPSWP